MESAVLNYLKFEMSAPTVKCFLRLAKMITSYNSLYIYHTIFTNPLNLFQTLFSGCPGGS